MEHSLKGKEELHAKQVSRELSPSEALEAKLSSE
jgi:hypothetical protein